ncbi:MAG TPA: alpha/beta fold hydrolase [Ktedonobacteraceae bacterium]|nr:alpha/beta fold hydrolase [Ktedonobacteraceae bacterium]
MSTPVIPGAESVSIAEGTQGGVVLLHGYMGTVQTVRDWALAFARAGFAVEAPLLPGHGTSVEEQLKTQWSDYANCADEAYKKLAARHQHVFVGGICTGGMLAAWLGLRYPETAGLLFVNGFMRPPKHWNFGFMDELLATNRRYFGWFRGKAVEDPDAPAIIGYEHAAIEPIMSMKPPQREMWPRLNELSCPILIFSGKLDKVVPLEDTRNWSDRVAGPVEHVMLERSNHVATMDYDKNIIEERSVEFALSIVKGEYKPAVETAAR